MHASSVSPFPSFSATSASVVLDKRVIGGGWPKAARFFDTSLKQDGPGPGASYHLPSVFNEHIQGPVYRQPFDSPRDGVGLSSTTTTGAESRSNPNSPRRHFSSTDGPVGSHAGGSTTSRDRTTWLFGVAKNDLTYHGSSVGGSSNVGPGEYSPSPNQVVQASPRTIFGKDRRFHTTSRVSNGPGPSKYLPKQCRLDLTAPNAPEISFGKPSERNERSKFIHAVLKDGYIYPTRPSTSGPSVNVGPAQYDVHFTPIEPQPPRPLFPKADRFRSQEFIFISRRHNKTKQGQASPGPAYYYAGYDLANNLKQKGKPANIPSGRWAP